MSALPAHISRVPNTLASQLSLGAISRSNVALVRLQSQISTGQAVNQLSDDPIKSALIIALQSRLEAQQQQRANLDASANIINLHDSNVGDANALVLEAKAIAAGQIGLTSDAATRRNQAVVIDGMIAQVLELANRQTAGIHLFGGSTPTTRPLESAALGFRYVARGSGMITDLGQPEEIPLTLGADSAIGQTSARSTPGVDLNPALTPQTRLADLAGARGLGITPGAINLTFNAGPTATVDLAAARSVEDVLTALTAAIRQYETDNAVTILGPAGVSTNAGSITIDVLPGPPPASPPLTFSDLGAGSTAADLGLSQAPFTALNPAGADLDARLSWLTDLAALPGVTLPLGSLRVRLTRDDTSRITDVDLSAASSLDDVRTAIASAVPGVRLDLAPDARSLAVVNELSGPTLAIEEVPGSTTAAQLGIRTGTPLTPTSQLNNARGVRIVTGAVDPVTGAPSPQANVDFVIRLNTGEEIPVDLRPQDLANLAGIISRINDQIDDAELAGLVPPGSLSAGFADGPNAIALNDLNATGGITVLKRNNSAAAEDLGLLNAQYDPATSTLVAQDRSGVRVNSLLTTLMDLRDALLRDDSTGIAIAGEQLDAAVDRLASTRALVGVRANRIERAKDRTDQRITFDEQVRSQLQDLDYAEASTRFSQLQTQLQAGLQTAARTQSLTLLDFLG